MVVQLFVTCLVNGLFPDVGKAVVAVLEGEGHRVEFPRDQTCCGQPAFNGGFREEAAAMARHTVDVLAATTGPVVVPSGSCAAMIIHHIPELLGDEPGYAAEAAQLAARTREFTRFLAETGARPSGKLGDGPITYHASCHGLRDLAILEEPKALLDGAGCDRVELEGEDECCGFGGLFSVEMPEISMAMMQTKIDNVVASGATTLVGIDVSCLMHLEGGMRRRGVPIDVKHVAQVLAGPDR